MYLCPSAQHPSCLTDGWWGVKHSVLLRTLQMTSLGGFADPKYGWHQAKGITTVMDDRIEAQNEFYKLKDSLKSIREDVLGIT